MGWKSFVLLTTGLGLDRRKPNKVKCKLSIVTTLYRSRLTIEEFVQRAIAAAEAITDDIELVIVDDGSPDDSAAIVRKSVDADPRILLVELSRNFGHHRAMLAGLEQARGDLVFLIDSDLEEPPELLSEMADVLREKSVDCVYGLQQSARAAMSRGCLVDYSTGFSAH